MRILFVLAFLIAPLSAREYVRAFTSSDGKVLHAALVEADDGKVTLARATDGREFTLPIERLSKADQEYIAAQRVKNTPAKHPLGWKRLRVHAPPPCIESAVIVHAGQPVHVGADENDAR